MRPTTSASEKHWAPTFPRHFESRRQSVNLRVPWLSLKVESSARQAHKIAVLPMLKIDMRTHGAIGMPAWWHNIRLPRASASELLHSVYDAYTFVWRCDRCAAPGAGYGAFLDRVGFALGFASMSWRHVKQIRSRPSNNQAYADGSFTEQQTLHTDSANRALRTEELQ